MTNHFVSHPETGRWRLAALLPALLALALVASCDLIAGVDELVANEPCKSDGECPAMDKCHNATCDNSECVQHLLPADTVCDDDGFRTCDALGRCLCPAVGCALDAPCVDNSECESWFCNEKGECGPTPCGGPCPGVCWQCSEETNTCKVLQAGETAGGNCPDGCDGEGNCQSCTNTIQDPSETGLNCGGPKCPPCADGLGCLMPSDCQSCLCVEDLCLPPDCSNHVQDGCESAMDCGGPCGSTCAPGEACKSKQDCASHSCIDGVCG